MSGRIALCALQSTQIALCIMAFAWWKPWPEHSSAKTGSRTIASSTHLIATSRNTFGPTMATTGSRSTFARRPPRTLSFGRKNEELERYECSDLEALKMLFVNEYSQWKDVVTLRRPLIYKEVPTPYQVVDELLPKNKQRPLDFSNLLCVARKPTVTAAGFEIAPDNARERRSDRFDQEAFDPAAEGNLTRWRYVSMLAMPELTCPWCRKVFPEGMLICMACGLSLATSGHYV